MKLSTTILLATCLKSNAFAPSTFSSPKSTQLALQHNNHDNDSNVSMKSALASAMLGLVVSSASVFGGPAAFAADSAQYDGFAEYAKENKMEQSDVGCFVQKCGDQTKALFSNPRGIKGVTCLGRCKGEQACATRCFAEFGSEDLNNWLSCTIEENECVKVPKNVDNSAENVGYKTAIRKFDPKSLIGTWYKSKFPACTHYRLPAWTLTVLARSRRIKSKLRQVRLSNQHIHSVGV